MKRLLRLLFPPNTRRRRLLRAVLSRTGLRNYNFANYYNTWVYQYKALPPLQSLDAEVMQTGPLLSIVVPAFNTPQQPLLELVYSIVSQAYGNWELLLVDASSDETASARIADCAAIDSRITVLPTTNAGIAANTNVGISQARGSYVVLIDHDDTIEPFALAEIVAAIHDTDSDLLYSDEDKITENGQIFYDPFFKPAWSPDLLTHVNYVNHLTAIRKSLLDTVGGLNPDRDGAQDYDLFLRLVDAGAKVHHIPQVLYHWRAAQTSTAQNFSVKTDVVKAGERALADHYARRGITGVKVQAKADRPGFYDSHFPLPTQVSIIILPFASSALLRTYVNTLLATTDYRKVRLQLIMPTEQTVDVPKAVQLVTLPPDNHFMTAALQAATSSELVVLGRPIIPDQPTWPALLSSRLVLPHVRALAPLITHNASLIEDSGLVLGVDGSLLPLFANEPAHPHQTFLGNTDWVRDVDALTGAVAAVRRDELAEFVHQHPKMPAHQLLRQFTIDRPTNSYNVLLPDVTFDDRAIRFRPPAVPKASFVNPMVYRTGDGYELYTPEAAAIQLLTQVTEAAPVTPEEADA